MRTLLYEHIFNEWYAKDISKKRRIVNKLKGNSGVPLSVPPYGYIKDPENPKRWIVDEEAAEVVRRIFQMRYDGYGIGEISSILSADKVLTPHRLLEKQGDGAGRQKDGP